MRRTLWLFALLLTWPVRADAAQIKVCAAGCTYNNSQLQNALNAAVDGDEILLESGHTYVAPGESYILGQRCATPTWDCITLRTGVTSTGSIIALSNFPAVGIRMDMSYRTASTGKAALAKFIPGYNNISSIRTVLPAEVSTGLCAAHPCRGSGWTLKWLEFTPKVDWLSRAYIQFGSNQVALATPGLQGQDTVAEVPHYLSLIQCDLHGDPVGGQYQGITLSTAETRIIGNSFRDFKSMSEDQALTATNGLGPHLVENNYFEASTENVIWGGSDPYLMAYAVVTGTPTTTVLPMNNPVWYHWGHAPVDTESASFLDAIYSGIFVAVYHGSVWYPGVTCTLTAVTASTATCTLNQALPFTPITGDLVGWTWVESGVTVRYNVFTKPLSWRDPILAMPTGLSVKAGGGGSLGSGTYCYRVQGRLFVSGNDPSDPADTVYSLATPEQCVTTSGAVAMSWNPVTNATSYRIFARATGAQNQYFTVTAPTTTFTDTGGTGTAMVLPHYGYPSPESESNWRCASNDQPYSCWKVKNSFEFKGCDGLGPGGSCLVEFNIFENSWCCMQDNIVAIKIQDQDGLNFSTTVRNLAFRNNWIRNGQRGLNLMGTEQGGATPAHVGGTMTDVVVSNNLITALSSSWNPDGGWYLSGSPLGLNGGGATWHVGPSNCIRCSLIHNTFLADSNNMKGPVFVNMDDAGDVMVDFVLRDNIMARDGDPATGLPTSLSAFHTNITDANQGIGTPSWNAAVGGASSATYNVWPQSNSTLYSFSTCGGVCGSAYYPSQATLQTYFTNYTACSTGTAITGCALNGSSPLDGAASDKTDVGANVAAMQDGIAIALSGDLSGGTPEPPLTPASAHGVRIRLRGGH